MDLACLPTYAGVGGWVRGWVGGSWEISYQRFLVIHYIVDEGQAGLLMSFADELALLSLSYVQTSQSRTARDVDDRELSSACARAHGQ